jgi:hypothetical protein
MANLGGRVAGDGDVPDRAEKHIGYVSGIALFAGADGDFRSANVLVPTRVPACSWPVCSPLFLVAADPLRVVAGSRRVIPYRFSGRMRSGIALAREQTAASIITASLAVDYSK